MSHTQEDQQPFTSKVLPFEECISFMEKVGRSIYGEHFRVYQEDYQVIFRLLVYFFRDKVNATTLGIDLRKGILLAGPVGVGKTSLMNIMNYFLSPQEKHTLKPCREITFDFFREGYQVIDHYGRGSFVNHKGDSVPRAYCFDDLGTEQPMNYYGNETNVLAEILLSRYDKFISHGMLTHITTNLSAPEIETRYGHRVRSRLREMVNLISFNDATDKRC